jgi:hypothetical protein
MGFSDEELDKSSRQFGIRSPLILFLTIFPPPEKKGSDLNIPCR